MKLFFSAAFSIFFIFSSMAQTPEEWLTKFEKTSYLETAR